jgi:23S rRNA pseudouridine1911/1915/1917 synthase
MGALPGGNGMSAQSCMNMPVSIRIRPEDAHQRIDRFLSRQGLLSQQGLDLSRSQIQKLLEMGRISVNGLAVSKASYSLQPEDKIEITLPEPKEPQIEPQDIPLDIIYEDDSIIVVNKPAGMVVHPAAGNYTGTLVNALLHHCRFLSVIGGVTRPGIVHRLDKDTSGLLVVAKTDAAHHSLSEQIKARMVKRIYRALVYGVLPQPEGEIETQIGRHVADRKKMSTVTRRGRLAITHYAVEEVFPSFSPLFSLLRVSLKTGRTHQIRVHLSYIRHPVVGDPVYGYHQPPPAIKKYPEVYQAVTDLKRQALHAESLGFTHPEQKTYLEFTAPLPEDFAHLLNVLREITE